MRSGFAARTRAATRSSAMSQETRRKPALAAAAEHRVREAAEPAQLGAAALSQRRDVGERVGVDRAHRVERQQREARRAEVDALDRPVAEAR